MEFPLRIFACVLTVFGTLEFIAPSVGFSLVAFTKNITTTGWSDIEDRLGPSLNRTHLEKQTKILAKIHKVENIVKGAEGIVEAIDPMKIMDVIESITVGSNIRHSFRSLLDSIEQIDADYNDMRIYARSPMNSRTLEDLTHNIVSHGDYSVKRLGMKIHNLLVPKRGIGLFAMFDRYNAVSMLCVSHKILCKKKEQLFM